MYMHLACIVYTREMLQMIEIFLQKRLLSGYYFFFRILYKHKNECIASFFCTDADRIKKLQVNSRKRAVCPAEVNEKRFSVVTQ